MPFTDTCKDIKVFGASLQAQCKTKDGSWQSSSLALDTILGNKDGAFVWGGKDWSKSARNWKYENGFLVAELKKQNDWIPCRLDLNANIANIDGMLSGVNLNGVNLNGVSLNGGLKADSQTAITQVKGAAAASAASATSSSSFSSTSSSSTSSQVTSSSSSSMTSVETSSGVSGYKFDYKTANIKFVSLVEAGCKLRLQGSILYAEWSTTEGIKSSSINLNLYIGNVNGVLEWEQRDFTRSCFDIHIKGTELVAMCKIKGSEKTVVATIDLAVQIFICNGRLVYRERNAALSVAMSEVPWMKFRVVAEPDFSVLYANAAIQGTMSKVAQSTVHHVTAAMESHMKMAIEQAISVVTASAMEHIAFQMQVMLADISGVAHIERSCSEATYLRSMSMPLPPLTPFRTGDVELGKFPAPPRYESQPVISKN